MADNSFGSDRPAAAGAGWLAHAVREAVPGVAGEVLATLQPAVRLIASVAADDTTTIGASKFGGAADLPPTMPWPTWSHPELGERALHFYGQIDLAEAAAVAPAPLALPASGLLSFFVDFDADGDGILGLYSWEQPGSLVVYSPAGTPLQRMAGPAALPAARLGMVGCWTWRADVVTLSLDEFERLDAVSLEYEQQLLHPAGAHAVGVLHQLGGHAAFIQHPVQEEVVQALAGLYESGGPFDEATWAEVEHTTADWRLVLQIDTDDQLGVMWGDAGRLYWAARQADVDAGRWDAGMFNFQCS